MRLYLAVAVLMLAFVAYTEATEAQELVEEQTMEQRLDQLKQTVTDQATATLDFLQNSEFAEKAKTFFSGLYENFKTKIEEYSQ